MDPEPVDGSYLSDSDSGDGMNQARFLLDELDESVIPETPSPSRLASRVADPPPPPSGGGPQGCRRKRRRLALEETGASPWPWSWSPGVPDHPANPHPSDGSPQPCSSSSTSSSSSSSSGTPSSSNSVVFVRGHHGPHHLCGLLGPGSEFEADWTLAVDRGGQPGLSLPPPAGPRLDPPLDPGSWPPWDALPPGCRLAQGPAAPGSGARPAPTRGRKRGRTRTPRPRPDLGTPDGASLSFLTEEERRWVHSGEQPAATPEEIYISDEEVAVVRTLQLEEDELMARSLQDQFDREERPPQQQQYTDHLRPPRQDHAYQDPRWSPTWASLPSALQDDLIGLPQRRGRGRARGQRNQRRPDLTEDLQGNDYEALLRFEEQQGSVVNRKLMSRQQIDRFPTKTYSPAPNAASTLCHICFCDYADGEQLRMLSCFHDYHVACIDRWLKDNATCPICRANMTES